MGRPRNIDTSALYRAHRQIEYPQWISPPVTLPSGGTVRTHAVFSVQEKRGPKPKNSRES